MAKRGKKRSSKKGPTIPLAIAAPLVSVGADYANSVKSQGFAQASRFLNEKMTGFDISTGQFHFSSMKYGALPVVVGGLVHKMASKVGINRAIAGAGIPWIRI